MTSQATIPKLTATEKTALKRILVAPHIRVRNGWLNQGKRISLRTARSLLSQNLVYRSTHTGRLFLYPSAAGKQLLSQ